jgi:hypothetical protein
MGVSGQRQAPAALYPRGKGPPVPIVQEAQDGGNIKYQSAIHTKIQGNNRVTVCLFPVSQNL